jgi:para-aminobenzoate synthetase component 1
MALSVLSPLDAAARLAGRRGRALLHTGAHAFVAADPHATLIARGRSLVTLDAAGRPSRRFTDDPLDAAEAFLAEHGCTLVPNAGALSDPAPRAIGYFGYDLVRVVETLPGGAALAHDGPDLFLAIYPAVAQISPDSLTITGPDPDACAALAHALSQPAPPTLAPSLGPLTPFDDDAHHLARIERVRDHIATGDVDHVALARRLIARVASPGDPLAVLAAITDLAPTPHAALLELDGISLLSASSECFLSSSSDRIHTSPLTPRGLGDAAAHQRTVSLTRDALAGVSASVTLHDLSDPTHLATRLSAIPRTGYAELLRALLPSPSITGSPRLRAMQLLDELEPIRRGPFSGALGHFTSTGPSLSVTTRLAVLARSELRIHALARIDASSSASAALASTALDAASWSSALALIDRQRAG